MESFFSTFNILETKHKIFYWVAYAILSTCFLFQTSFNFGALLFFLPYFLLSGAIFPFSVFPIIYIKNFVVNMFANIWMNLYLLLFVKTFIYGLFLFGLIITAVLSPLIGV